MSKFIVQMVNAYTREVLDTEDDIFDNEQDAEHYARECSGAFAEVAESPDLAGQAYTPQEDVDFVDEEVADEDSLPCLIRQGRYK